MFNKREWMILIYGNLGGALWCGVGHAIKGQHGRDFWLPVALAFVAQIVTRELIGRRLPPR